MATLEQVQTQLGALITQAMYMEEGELELDMLFSDFGLESTTLVKVVNQLNADLGVDVNIRDVLPHQTLAGASKVFHQPFTDEVA